MSNAKNTPPAVDNVTSVDSHDVTVIQNVTNISIAPVAAAPHPAPGHRAQGSRKHAKPAISHATVKPAALSKEDTVATTVTNEHDGDIVTIKRDQRTDPKKGGTGSVAYSRDHSTGEYTVILKDTNVELKLESLKAGFTGVRYVRDGLEYGGAERIDMNVKAGRGKNALDGVGTVVCDDHKFVFESPIPFLGTGKPLGYNDDKSTVYNPIIGLLTIREIQDFFTRHPGLAKDADIRALALTAVDGKSVTLSDVERDAPRTKEVKACVNKDVNVAGALTL